MCNVTNHEIQTTPGTKVESKKYEILTVVQSASRPGVSYEVRLGGDGKVYCTCPAWKFSGRGVGDKGCKHVRAVAPMYQYKK